MATLIRAVACGVWAIGIFTLAACIIARAEWFVWAGISVVFAIGMLFELLVLTHLRKARP